MLEYAKAPLFYAGPKKPCRTCGTPTGFRLRRGPRDANGLPVASCVSCPTGDEDVTP